MAKIPDAVIEQLKSAISVERLAEARGVALRRHGAEWIGLCPFHDDREPSLVVNSSKNLWHCLGACQSGGSVIDWVMKAEGVSFRHAVALLQDDYLPLAASGSGQVKRSTVQKLPAAIAPDADDAELLLKVIDYYHETLKQSLEAMAYLEKRGIADAEAIATFKLGFANRTLGYRLPEKNRKDGALLRGQLQRLGILRPSGHEHFNGSLVIPVMDATGRVSEVYGRKITPGLRKGTPLHLYLPGPHAGVWNAKALEVFPEVILCESLIDALTFWCAGYRNVTAAYGIEGFTEEHLATFTASGIERVLIAYDRDTAGEAAAEKLAKRLLEAGLDCHRVQFPKGMDANEYALKLTPARKSLGLVLRKAVWLGKGKAPAVTSAPAAAGIVDAADGEPVQTLSPATSAEADDGEAGFNPLAAEPALPESVPAGPVPQGPGDAVDAEVTEREVVFNFGERRYRVRGLSSNASDEQLKVNVLVAKGDALHVDTLNLYQAKAKGTFITETAAELGVEPDVIKRDLSSVLLKCETLQEARFRQAAEAKASTPLVRLTDREREAALAFLRSPDLLERIVADIERCGLVGEGTNALVCYLACVSRKLDKPLAVVIQSMSASGKSALMEAVLDLVPEEERVHYSAMTGQSLFYMGECDLKHRILAIAEEAGVQEAGYALKLLQSQGELTIASTGKDPQTGKLVTQSYRVEGPVMLFLTTTAIDLDEELKNRCLTLGINESRDQTRAIQARQRFAETLDGLLAAQARDDVLRLHRNAQRLLKPLKVVNPFAERLTFLDDKTRTRRDHQKYLMLIRAIALLHQHQREVKTARHGEKVIEYVEVTLADIALANRLAHEVLGPTSRWPTA
jgi:DNA primase catalytic core